MQGGSVRLSLPAGHTAALVALRGAVTVNGQQLLSEDQTAHLDRERGELEIEAKSDAVLLLLGGEPIDEPIVGHGPFVMNNRAEINQAVSDFESGNFWSHRVTSIATSRLSRLALNRRSARRQRSRSERLGWPNPATLAPQSARYCLTFFVGACTLSKGEPHEIVVKLLLASTALVVQGERPDH